MSLNILGQKIKTQSGEAFFRIDGDRFHVLHSVNGGVRAFNGTLKVECQDSSFFCERTIEDIVRILDYKHEERTLSADRLYFATQSLFELEPIIDCVIPPEAFNSTTDFLAFHTTHSRHIRLVIEIVDDKSVVFSWPERGHRFYCLKPRRLENVEGKEIKTVQVWTPDFFDSDIFKPENFIKKDRREEVRENKKPKKQFETVVSIKKTGIFK